MCECAPVSVSSLSILIPLVLRLMSLLSLCATLATMGNSVEFQPFLANNFDTKHGSFLSGLIYFEL